MTDKLKYWNTFAQPPMYALKEIKAGRLRGFSDINPMWRIKAMTETFGAVGDGWKYTIDKMWNSDVANDERVTFVQISLYYRLENGEWSEAIPGVGGSKLVAKESSGLHSNDEALKMALTDAQGVAMKALGMAADIYMGLWDGTKYITPANDFPKKIDTAKQVKEVLPTKDSKPVDEEFPKETSGAFTVSDLRKVENIEAIIAGSKKDTPVVLEAINGLDKNGTYTLKQVIELLGEKA